MATMEVKGLRRAAENLAVIGKVGATELSRAALRDAAQVINQKIKADTYGNFIRRTGAIRAGFGVRVARALKGSELLSFIVQHETTLALRPRKKRSRKPQPTKGLAFWWRYLEFGTKDRRTARTPKASKAKTPRTTKRGLAAFARYSAAKSQGDVKPRNWIRPAFASNAVPAINAFDASFRRRVDDAVSKLPKT